MSSILPILQSRNALKRATRNFFDRRQYLEVETPIVTRCPGTEVHLQYFETNWQDYRGQSHKRWLRSSPELHMKRLMAEGVERAYQVGPCFRNHGESSEWHNPEFTMLEWYQSDLSYHGMIRETEDYLRATADDLASITGLAPEKILPPSFEWIGVFDAFKNWAGIDLVDGDELSEKLKELSLGVRTEMVERVSVDAAWFKSI